MKRQLFLHHYLPALYVAILAVGALFDFVTDRAGAAAGLVAEKLDLSPRAHTGLRWVALRGPAILAILLLTWAAFEYWRFSPLSYGLQTTKERCEWIPKLKSTWDWTCKA